MRIAHCVESYLPAIGGMVEVVRQLSERMVRGGHEVTVLTSSHPDRHDHTINGVRIREFAVSGNSVRGVRGEGSSYVDALLTGDFDIVVFFAAQQWATDLALPHLPGIRGRKVLVPTGFSALNDPAWKDYFDKMPGWMAGMDLNIFHSEGYQDVRFAQAHGIRNTACIPNGAAEEEFDTPAHGNLLTSLGIRDDRTLILHVGSFTNIKGHKEAMRIFVKAATGDAVLLFVGNGVYELERLFRTHWRFLPLRLRAMRSGKRILFREFDRSTTVDAMKQADLFLFPSQVECSPIVLFESMAARVPFLASEAGNAAEIALWGGGGWTVPGLRDEHGRMHIDVEHAAKKLGTVMADRDLLLRTGRSGRDAWKAQFTWRAIADRYLHAYHQVIDRA
ncbi:MAG: glycosyltransferase family 4 protein [Bacteroidetes bacterium]|nr:glycosyltransferase family 4 protein [Bacteroidota bacterium]